MTEQPANTPKKTQNPQNNPTEPARPKLPLAITTLIVAALGTGLARYFDRLDSALFFVGLPCLLAFGIGSLPGKPGWGRIVQVVTVITLLISALLHENSFCLLLASPVILAATWVGWKITRLTKRRHQALILPVIALIACEGITSSAQTFPHQTATASTTVPATCQDVHARLAAGPKPQPGDRATLLTVAPYPTPKKGTGTGMELADEWQITIAKGTVNSTITNHSENALTFTVTEDTSKANRWVVLESGTITWTPTEAGCHVDLAIDYRRKLNPGFWFGPVTQAFMTAGTDTFLASLT